MNTIPFTRIALFLGPVLSGTFVSLLFSFWWTRAHTQANLGLHTLPSLGMQVRAVVSGALSDVWIAACLAIVLTAVLLPVLVPLALWKRKSVALALSFFVLVGMSVVVGFLVGSHVPYVEFFGTLLSWQHLRYLGDEGFVRASVDSLLSEAVWGCGVGAGVVASLVWWAVLPFSQGARGKPLGRFFLALPALLLMVGGSAQAFKVRANTLSWGWRVPPSLKLNYLENAAIQWWRAEKTPDPTPQDVQRLEAYAKEWGLWPERSVRAEQPGDDDELPGYDDEQEEARLASLKASLEGRFLPAEPGSVGDVLKAIVQHRLLARQPVYVFILVLESFRPEESKVYVPSLAETATPAFDALAGEGLVYKNMFTTGAVTRGGQEALLCGLLSAELTSAMRDLPSASPRCLPKLLKEALGEENVFAAWWHGGDFNFDSQGTFWRRQGTDFLLSREDFLEEPRADTLPGTWWGVSDFTLVERMKLRLLDAKPTARVFLHTFLSITNHPSWVLPVDAPLSWHQGDTERWNQFKPLLTTRYTDEALNRLVTHLKDTVCYLCESGTLWDNSIVLVSSDHGSLMPSPFRSEGYGWGLSESEDVQAVRAASHASFLLTGGLVGASLRGLGLVPPVEVTTLHSQLDVFATLADVFGLGPDQGVRTVGDSLFAARRRWPVVVDLGNRVAFPRSPGAARVWERGDLLKEGLAEGTGTGTGEGFEPAYFRGVQFLLSQGQAGN